MKNLRNICYKPYQYRSAKLINKIYKSLKIHLQSNKLIRNMLI